MHHKLIREFIEYEKPTSPETKPEQIPTLQEVYSEFQELLGEQLWENYEEDRRSYDDKGWYLLEGHIPGETEDEKIGIEYMRKGRYDEGQASKTTIYKVYYKKEVAIGGELIAEYIDGKWISVPLDPEE